MEENMTNYKKVRQFNRTFGHMVSVKPYTTIFNDNPKIVRLRNNLISEEYGELIEAFNNKDIVEVIDALCDIQYVAYGLLVVYGINGDDGFKEFIRLNPYNEMRNENMSLLSNFDISEKIVRQELMDNTVDISYMSPNTFFEILDNNNHFHTLVESVLNTIQSNLVTLHDATQTHDFDSVINSTFNIIYFTYNLGVLVRVNIDSGVDLVHQSNMSKLCTDRDEAQKTVEWYIKNDTRYDTPVYKENVNGFIIFNESSGKILKNINYKAVDLSSLIV